MANVGAGQHAERIVNPYQLLTQSGRESERQLSVELREWHDSMVRHQRSVGRLPAGAGCADDCPHAEAVRLWHEATMLLGAEAERLTFLRACAAAAAPAPPRLSKGR
jgi:hypothetical protein